ncbi:efflux RND transporter permease subunit [Roseimaritima ulvae]|uniref:Efflux pump membrane transporter BepE n=1 Tax=Roseimaritima ulvae TaxID=980254 RepID=A0A5B9R1L2_9BACT|nr:efflux RND transporter permease subunit [Roseimaritima ulvae]QEG43695.1 Efflux pump membrane transporter BepE [Roseimaritima ulvae]
MTFIEACVNNPVKVSVGALLVILFGCIALFRMPMQLIPEVQTPTLTVDTIWPGASPQEVEREITQEQEEQLKSVEGLTKLSSESMDSRASITLEFAVGTDMEESLLKVNSRLQQVREYPEDADQPVISTSNASDRPIAWFILSALQPTPGEIRQLAEEQSAGAAAADNADPSSLSAQLRKIADTDNPGLRLLRLRKLAGQYPQVAPLLPPDLNVPGMRRFAEDTIEARLERVGGVSNANVLGGLEEELQVVVDPDRLAFRQLTIDDVRAVLRQQNRDTSGGDFWEGKRRYVVRTINQFESPEEVGAQILATRGGIPIYIRDVAEVRMGFKKPDGMVRRFGESAIAINALRETGANVLDVMDGLREGAEELNTQILREKKLQLTQVYDETEYIYASVGLVNQNIIIGGSLTMIVLMLFLHWQRRSLLTVPIIVGTTLAAIFISPWFFAATLACILVSGFWFARGAVVVGVAIPISIIGTFLMLNLWGRSLNVISLAGMAFAVGMLVDNAVVVLENVYRHYQDGKSARQAAVEGGQEVWGAVLASTLTTLAVFLPVLFVEEEAGQLFRDIALAISAAVGLSLIVSITLIPTAAARLLAGTHRGGSANTDEVREVSPRDTRMVRGIVLINRLIQSSLLLRLGVVVGLVGVAVGVSYLVWPKVEYLPSGNRNLVFGILLPPAGYNLDELSGIGELVEDHLQPYWDVEPGSEAAEQLKYPPIFDFFYVARGRQVFLGVRAVDATRAAELVPLIQEVRKKLEGTFVVAKQSSLFEQGLTAGRTIDVEITGPELKQLVSIGGQVLGKTMQLMPEAQARPVPSLDLSSPEYHLKPRLLQNDQMGVDATSLGYTIDALVDGAYATDYFVGGDKIDLTIIGSPASIRHSQDVDTLQIATPGGQLVPVSTLATPSMSSGPEQVNHRERQRAITIEVSPPPSIPLENALETIETEIVAPLRASGQLDGGYQVNLSGTADKLRDTWEALRWNVLLALLITYLLMAALFESWIYPLVIILSVPLGAVGGVLGLRALGVYLQAQGMPPQPLDVLTMLGFVILIGTVVNNAILIVHQSLNLMREQQLDVQAAIQESVRTRVRPIAMTTATTVLGLCPLVLFPGAGSELYRGLGSVLLGGLLVSTIFTLFFVPALFRILMDTRNRLFGTT